MISRSAFILLASGIFLTGCSSVKYYKPAASGNNTAWVQVDGSESRRGIPLIGARYYTWLHVWRMYPDTCESYYYGVIKAAKNKTTGRMPLQAGVPVQINAIRERTSSSRGAYTTNHHSDMLNRRLFFTPKADHGYVIRINDLDRNLYDVSLIEVAGNDSQKIPLTSVVSNDNCGDRYKDLKRLR